jgi:hypothetical protein
VPLHIDGIVGLLVRSLYEPLVATVARSEGCTAESARPSEVCTPEARSVEGMPVILAPDNYFAATTNFIIAHTSAVVAPIKLTDYVTHINPPGINGTLVEGRIRHAAHALKNKAVAIYLNTSGSKPSGATGTGV